VVALDSSEPDLDEGQIGRENYAWLDWELRGWDRGPKILVIYHHLLDIPGTGRDRNILWLWQDQGLVFPSKVGTPLSARNLQRHFKSLLERAGLSKSFRFHDLRHTCATLLLGQGVNPKFVQELLGHADISLTLNVYSHVLPDMGDAAAGAMDDALE
jgi:integrase